MLYLVLVTPSIKGVTSRRLTLSIGDKRIREFFAIIGLQLGNNKGRLVDHVIQKLLGALCTLVGKDLHIDPA